MENSIIDSSSPAIVATEVQIYLSNEKLKNLLMKTYEAAQRQERSVKYYDAYGPLLSIAGTLFLTLLTADFKTIGNLDSATVNGVVWVITAACFLLGTSFLYLKYMDKTSGSTDERDEAISEIFRNISLNDL